MKKFIRALLLISLALAACQAATASPTPGVDGTIQTADRATAAALETLLAVTPTAAPTQTPQDTPTLRPSSTPQPSNTPLPSATPVTATPTPLVACDAADFVSDVTIPDNTVISAEAGFTKTWRLKNIGTCTWTSSYSVVFSAGTSMTATLEYKLARDVLPGETTDISVNLVALKNPGNYIGWWKLRNAAGQQFGTGPAHDKGFWVRINVGSFELENPDLTASYCEAVWKSSTGSVTCPSPKVDFNNGTVTVSKAPTLEGGSVDNEPGLVVIPSDGPNGYISATFPPFKLHTGVHFKALTGCTDKTPKCSVSFRVKYRLEGSSDESNIKQWDESYNGQLTPVDIDLSFLNGKRAQLILIVENKNGSSLDDVAIWLAPRITAQ